MKRNKTLKIWGLIFGAAAVVSFGMTMYSLKDDFFEWWDNRQLEMQYASSEAVSTGSAPTSSSAVSQTSSAAPVVRLTLEQMQEVNDDTVGLISIPYFDLYYPVVQTEDNTYYLTHSFTDRKSKNGAIFLDYRNKLAEQNQNFILFGHNNKNNLMFARLNRYNPFTGLAAYQRAPTVIFQSIEGHRDWKIFAICIFNSNPENGTVFPYLRSTFPTEEIFNNYIAEIQARNMLSNVDVDVTYGDALLTLSTCTYDFKDARIVIFTRAVREGESTAVDTSGVKVNKSAYMPDIYVEKQGLGQKESIYLKAQAASAAAAAESAKAASDAVASSAE